MRPFAKYAGCGNDFILFDNREKTFPLSSHLIQRLCNRQSGIGADGLILLEHSDSADFRMRIFNADGSEAEMCGNGLRCLVKWLSHMGFSLSPYRIEVMHHIITAHTIAHAVCLEIGMPTDVQWNVPIHYQGRLVHAQHLNTGVPHAVLFVEELGSFPLIEIAPFIRSHPHWAPHGTNVTAVQIMDSKNIKIRTYERGVERETLACGTGAIAATLATAHHFHFTGPLTVHPLSGEELKVGFQKEKDFFSQVTLTGPVQFQFQGEIDCS